MKNLIVSLSLVLATGLTPVFAAGTNNDPRVEKVFAKQFAGAENVKWTEVEDECLKVSFTLNGIRAEAYYSKDAEMLGAVRDLFYSQLPLVVMQKIGAAFTNSVIIEVREITSPDGTDYRVVLEYQNKKYNLKLSSLGEIIEKRKQAK